MTLDTLEIRCSLVQWKGEKGHCNWCDNELTGRQQRWCSPACSTAYGDNHWWGYASKAAKERDGHRCTRCGQSPAAFTEPMPEIAHQTSYSDFAARFKSLGAVANVQAWRDLRREEARPLRDWQDRKDNHERRTRLEVHHLEAALGRHNRPDCIHHLDNLVTLCHACHLEAEREKKLAAWELRNQIVLPI